MARSDCSPMVVKSSNLSISISKIIDESSMESLIRHLFFIERAARFSDVLTGHTCDLVSAFSRSKLSSYIIASLPAPCRRQKPHYMYLYISLNLCHKRSKSCSLLNLAHFNKLVHFPHAIRIQCSNLRNYLDQP